MESKQLEKSQKEKRKEKRKEARLEKHKNRHKSWVEHHQKLSNLKKTNAKQKKEEKPEDVPMEEEIEAIDAYVEEEIEEKPKKSSVKVKKEKKSLKRKSKTKFDEYLEMDMNKGMVSAEEDLKLERRLAKKLKIKKGKLRGFDDEINNLFDGIPSILDSATDGEEGIKSKKKSSKRKEKKTTLSVEEVENEEKEASDSELAEDATEESCKKPPQATESVKYVAPHLRSRTRDESEEHTQIRRRVRGLLNRLSESNVESITQEMSTICGSIGRSSGSQIIIEEILTSCSGGPRGNEQYAAVFAAFVAGMACSVGIDFGAKLIASLAKSFEDEYMKEDNLSLRNLTLLLSYLFIFGICSSDLIYDFLNILSKRLMEIDVSTILTVLQCCGMKLRGDDPSSMKDFILSVQSRVNELKSPSGSMPDDQLTISNKRMEFMLETILDIKNNKKRVKEDPAHFSRIKQWLQKLRVDDVLLRGLKWNRLLDVDKKGQWWLPEDVASKADKAEEVAKTIDKEVLVAQKLLELAAAQRMNTDARRAIFCIIMSGEDYVDAFKKLLELNLHGKQDREIMRVLVKCCLQEKVFNKYYCILASKLCSHDKNHKFTLQYCLWDYYKELESMELIQSMNLARFAAEMLVSFSLSLAVLKMVDLSDIGQLTPKRVMHFRMLFEAIFENSDAQIWNMFTRVAVVPELEPLRNGVEFFIKRYVLSSNKTFSDKFKIAKKALSNVEGVLM